MTKVITSVIVITAGLFMASYLIGFSPSKNLELESKFEGFINEYTPIYTTDAEYDYRLGVFAENMKIAEELQESNPMAKFGITPFSDRTPEEMQQMMGLSQELQDDLDQEQQQVSKSNWLVERWFRKSHDLTKSKNWKDHFHPVQNQKQCGSCWAFATTAVLEAHRSIKGLGKDKLSEQQLVDCEPATHGCNGGISAYAYGWYKDHDACSSNDYHYIGLQGACKTDRCSSLGVHDEVHGAGWVKSGEPGILDRIQNHGPVTVSIDATIWNTYQSGIMSQGCYKKGINHEVVVTGFKAQHSSPHYIIRNSWSESWGEQGTIRILYGKGVCGIHKQSFYPVLN
ncbi:unnamed protein product [Moneuplotes crassus]|uniref:Papain family cysteine protease n=1 Tax=Euplotes crassus TaxID=5936 RepID=A0AAD1XLK5_EUPCR|nr:unnamed protein product [Moneuplotes crassus]